jgi:hypothetical protein
VLGAGCDLAAVGTSRTEVSTDEARRYWSLVSHGTTSEVRRWIDEVDPDEADDTHLVWRAFACMRVFVGGDLLMAPACIDAVETAAARVPDNLNAQALREYTHAVIALALDDTSAIERRIGALETLGTEGKVVAAMALGMSHDPLLLQRALALLDDCREVCAPSDQGHLARDKKLGMLLVLAEVTGRLERHDDMERVLLRAEDLAVAEAWPYQDDIEALRRRMSAPDWARITVGRLSVPLPMFSDERACGRCHSRDLP